MLYVFYVDTGTMLQFEMNYALESVAQLGEAIEKCTRIPQDKQVLLVSGGESLDSAARVCSYSAGTDTNPIYLFSKINTDTPPQPSINYGIDQDLKEQVEASDSMEPNYTSVVVRTQLAQQFYDMAREQTRVCEQLVHDQHLMQQGWAAVMANMEDITTNYRSVCENVKMTVSQFLLTRNESVELVENYKQDVAVLSKIPMIPALLEDWADLTLSCASSGRSSKEGSLQRETDPKCGSAESSGEGQEDPVKPSETQVESGNGGSSEPVSGISKSLLQWIDTKDRKFSIEGIAELCTRILNQIHTASFEELKLDAENVMEAVTKQELKEIKGLEERLYGLEQLMYEARRIVQEQKDMAMSFQQNQKRVSNLKDPSIFPDLCASHQRQLKVMSDNQHRLMDIRRRCTRAKEELCNNLFQRLRWVVFSENGMFESSNKLMAYLENTKRLRRTLDVIRQVHVSPEMYLKAVCEVVRRRSFSEAYLSWASDLACQLLRVHNEEVARRRDFQNQFSGHFLNSLFPGMEDMPPPFATQAPSPFDAQLPKLTLGDVHLLQEQLPELAPFIYLPDVDAITNFFLTKSVLGTTKVENKETMTQVQAGPSEPQSLQSADVSVSKPSPISIQTSAPKEVDRGFESETDTEEFEKVGQSPIKLTCSEATEEMPASPRVAGQASAVALLEVGVPEVKKLQASPSPSSSCSMHSPSLTHSHLSAQHHQQTQQEFATTEYYIDDSMPSSYTESSGAKCHHPPASELQRQLEDMNTLVALLQENLGNTRNEVERLRNHLVSAGRLVADVVAVVRGELVALRVAMGSNQEFLCQCSSELLAALERHRVAMEDGEMSRRDEAARVVQQLTIEHELEMDALKQEVKAFTDVKEEEIRQLKLELMDKDRQLNGLRADMEHRLEEEVAARALMVRDLEARISDMREQIGSMQQQIDRAETCKQQAIQEVQERLNREYKTELESLRSRYRLMATASMERSPSDSSLERIERADLIELMNHEAIVQQVRDDMEDQREAAVKAAVDQERAVFEARLEHELRLARTRSEAERQVWFNEAMRRVVDEKERQMEALRTREATLMAECQRYQETIRNLTDCSREAGGSLDSKMSGSTVWQLLDRIELLKAEKRRVEAELARERSRKTRTLSETAATDDAEESRLHMGHEMSSSVAVVQDSSGSRDAATSPDPASRNLHEDRLRDKLSQSTTTLIQQGKISIMSCNIGDAVLVVWDEEHQNYTILQESSTLYFLHTDCLDSLGLKIQSGDSPRRLYSTGEVIEKEYCHAKKAENRYRVPKGTKFYRVKVRPVQKENLLSRKPSTSNTAQRNDAQCEDEQLQRSEREKEHHSNEVSVDKTDESSSSGYLKE
ncbi:Uncharacterized protein GBIM_03857 [Gryllus bimaculatus]|nr:Uncharacterized protein GBIM_03857 [Gryllus bimaculatus]